MVKRCNQSGIGIDIIEIDRVQKAINRHKRFINKIFTDIEINYFKSKNMKTQSIAGYFAAKEAIGKALGTGIYKGKWKDIEIHKSASGQPSVKLYGDINEYAREHRICDINISISHCHSYAVANAIAYKEEI